MKKLALIFAAIVICAASTNAQDLFGEGTKLIKVGLGLNGYGIPVEVSYEKGIKENFLGVDGLVLGLGGNLGYYGYSEDFSGFGGNYSWKYSNIVLAARGLGHYSFIPKLDTYAGLVLGYNIANVKYDGPSGSLLDSPSAGGLVLGGLVGARYEFNEKWGAYMELGYSISYATVGVAYKF